MTEDEYTNLDLDTADELLVAAGHPSIAKALRLQTQANRNLVQGEWGKSFANSLDVILGKHVKVLSDEIGGLRGDTNALQAEFHAGLSTIHSTVSTLVETVDGLQAAADHLQTQMHESQEDRRAIHTEVAEVRTDVEAMKTEIAADIQTRLGRLELSLARFESIEASLAALVARIGDALPTEADQAISAELRVDEAKRGDVRR